ncbi:fungal-specific transcription factor domain-containing protein [Penicillium chermesinum]|nr:fungal-specific transcription factor domain-containing protein [Penicillium chermesinum]
MAMHSPPLLNALIAWSSSHLSLRDDSFRHVAMQNRCAALSDLRAALQNEPVSMEMNLAMSLVLCSLESIMADNGDAWYLHLAGAAGVISSNANITDHLNKTSPVPLLQNFEDAHAGRWLLRNFAYRDIVMAVARDRAPLLNSYLFLQLDDARLPDSHFGLAFEILEIISQIATLNEQRKSEGSTEIGQPLDSQVAVQNTNPSPLIVPPDLLGSLQALEYRLQQWVCPQSTDMSLKLLAESYRGSALIYLYRVMRGISPSEKPDLSSKIMSQVAAVVGNIEQMPTRSLPECTLLFPLFLAGGRSHHRVAHQEYSASDARHD